MKPHVADTHTRTLCLRIEPVTGAPIFLTQHPRDLVMTNGLINNRGLVVNNLQDLAGRGSYFPAAAGTSEGQFLMIRAAALAYQATSNEVWADLVRRLTENVEEHFYRGTPPSHLPWAPHWLVAVKKSFVGEALQYGFAFTFTAGVCTIPPGRPYFGELVRQVFHARTPGSTYIWDNPYSLLSSGTQYSVASFVTDEVGTVVTLDDTGVNTVLHVTYSTTQGDRVNANEPFEAWPVWRRLEATEIDTAIDSMAWAYDAWDEAYNALGDAAYADRRDATRDSMEQVYRVNDGRAWITRGYIAPLGLGGAYVYNTVLPAPLLGRDGDGNIRWTVRRPLVVVGPYTQAQFGRGGLADTWLAADSIQVIMKTDVTIDVTVFIDSSTTVDTTTRFAHTFTLTAGDFVTTNIARTSFVDNFGFGSNSPAIGSPIATAGVQISPGAPCNIVIQEVRPKPDIDMPYMPGAIPFTANFLGGDLVTWRGPVYSGYQAPWVWPIAGTAGALANCLDFLQDAAAAYTVSTGIVGPFAPVFILPRADSVSFGTPGTFTWDGPDPNTGWGGYQYRPLEATARYWAGAGSPTATVAAAIVTDFLTWIAANWTSANDFPPTDFPEASPPEANYESPHFAALIMRAAMWADLAGASTALTRPLIAQCLNYLNRLFAAGGPMGGTWRGETDTDYYGFENGEMVSACALMLTTGSAILTAVGFPAATIEGWLDANADFLNTQPALGNRYLSAAGYEFTGYSAGSGTSPAMVDLSGIAGLAGVDLDKLNSGLFDNARCYLFATSWTQPVEDEEPIVASILGKTVLRDAHYSIQEMALIDALNQKVGESYSPMCKKVFGGQEYGGCKKVVAPVFGAITAVTDHAIFTDSGRAEPDDYFGLGHIAFLTGANAGLAPLEIKSYAADGTIEVFEPFYHLPAIGDTYTMFPGCRKRQDEDCRDKWDNVVNFGGFSFLPTAAQYSAVGRR